MSYYITEDCISCGACEPECPNQAISEGETIYIINPDRCTECVGAYESPRCAAVCPVDACHPDPKYPETREQLLEKWRGLHPDEEPAEDNHQSNFRRHEQWSKNQPVRNFWSWQLK